MKRQSKQRSEGNDVTRRTFMRDGAITAAGLTVGLVAAGSQSAHAESTQDKTRSYNPEMEYHRLGKTGLWISAVCLGGHWKRVDKMVPGVFKGKGWLDADLDMDGFVKNRYDVVTRCIENGINYIDACTWQEVVTYARALKDRREQMYLGFSWYQEEMRKEDFRTAKALLGTLDKGMREAKLEYADVWRITMLSQSGRHTEAEVNEMVDALEKAKKQGKVRFTGLSSHDREHIKWMIETYPNTVQVVCTPYTAKSKVLPTDSVFDAVKKHDVGVFGIKPFAGTSLFKGDSSPESPTAEEDDRLARMAIRYILCNPAITAPIPGMINAHQVDNMARAVKEHRELDVAEAKELETAMDEAWAKLPAHYQWLKDWEYV
ncbi:MAG TPA: aldo/keto reductase [Sedimentisphaerales bacterium]|nr:aldo/keto reductase [Sedimentisphaerales bacterium]